MDLRMRVGTLRGSKGLANRGVGWRVCGRGGLPI